MPVEADHGDGAISLGGLLQAGNKAPARTGDVVLDRGIQAENGQRLLRAFDDPLLLGTDEAHEAHRFLLYHMLARLARLTFQIGRDGQCREQSDDHDGEQTRQ